MHDSKNSLRAIMFNSLPGFREFYPEECARRNFLFDAFRRVALRFFGHASARGHRVERRPARVPLQGRRVHIIIRNLQDRLFCFFSHEGTINSRRNRPEARVAMHGRFRRDGRRAGRRVPSAQQPELCDAVLRRRANLPDPRESENSRDRSSGSSLTLEEII